MTRRRRTQNRPTEEAVDLVRLCDQCRAEDHENCPGTVLEAWGQYAACGCQCDGGLEAWVNGL